MKRAHEEDDNCEPNSNLSTAHSVDVQTKIAKHYNEIKEKGLKARNESQILHLKNFNNWLKSSLISRFVLEEDSILDLACGKGGDLQKFAAHHVRHVVLVDNASNSVHDALQRYNSLHHRSFGAIFMVADCWKIRLDPHLPKNLSFNLVSCQFALHYSFESETQVRRMFENVTDRLRPGGYFIGTIPDAEFILRRLRQLPPDALQFGNDCYTVRVREKFEWLKPSEEGKSVSSVPEFGAEYIFTLQEAVTDCPEWIVQIPVLKRIAAEYGLELTESTPFHQYFFERSKKSSHRELLSRFRMLDADVKIPSAQWEALGFYRTFVFRRPRSNTDTRAANVRWNEKFAFDSPKNAKAEDVIDLTTTKTE